MMIECTACHVTMPNTPNGGPHGMHTIGQSWVGSHGDSINSLPGGVAACAICHGTDYRGTVLSRAQADRTLTPALIRLRSRSISTAERKSAVTSVTTDRAMTTPTTAFHPP